jgi:hypothetical protein
MLLIALIAPAAALALSRSKRENVLPCSNASRLGRIEDFCIGGYALVASYDALPVANQRELFSLQTKLPISKKGFQGFADSGGQFRVKGNWLQRTHVVVDIHSAASQIYPKKWQNVQTFLAHLDKIFNADIAKKFPKNSRASCDPANARALVKLHEEPLRRCLRTMFLLDMTDTFNDRTQKLFENQTIKYSDGTKGPLSLTRKSNTDSDRSKVVAAVKAIDNKARALGGYH